MIELLLIYKWTILAGTLMAPALALLGCHLAARDRAMQTLCVGQGATLGVLLGLGILQAVKWEGWEAVGPFLTAALGASAAFLYTEYGIKNRASKNTSFTAVFAFLLAAGYLVTALFPLLESHMTHVFFGDLATLSNSEAGVTSGLAVLIFLVFFWNLTAFNRRSFYSALFGRSEMRLENGARHVLFEVLALVSVAFSVQFLGFLFTIGCLFVPTVLALMGGFRGLKHHYWAATALAVLGSLCGFVVSLVYTRLSTVPAIVAAMVIFGALVGLAKRGKAVVFLTDRGASS